MSYKQISGTMAHKQYHWLRSLKKRTSESLSTKQTPRQSPRLIFPALVQVIKVGFKVVLFCIQSGSNRTF